jgi:hypothetical protein
VNLELVLALPIRSLQQSTKAIVFAFADGKKFWLVGGKCRRPLPQGVAGFTPAEMIEILKYDLNEAALRQIMQIKESMGGGRVIEIVYPTDGPTPPAGNPGSTPKGT